ncbi:MAG: ATP-binding protein [Bacteroidota bacterium]
MLRKLFLIAFVFFFLVLHSLGQESAWLHKLSSVVDSLETKQEISKERVEEWLRRADSLLQFSPYDANENAKFHYRFGELAFKNGAYKQAYSFWEAFLELEDDTQLVDKDVATAHYYLGLLYQWFADYELALLSYKKALNYLGDEADDQNVKAGVLRGLGNLYFQWNETDEAISYYRQSLGLYQVLSDTSGIAKCYNNMGRIFTDKGEYAKGLELLNSSLSIKRNNGDFVGMFNTYINMGRAYQRQDSTERARNYFQLANELAEYLDNDLLLAEVNSYLGNLAADQAQLDSAVVYYEKSLDYSDSTHYQRWLIEGHRALARIWEKQGDFQKSLQHYKTYKLYEDSVFNEDTRFLIEAYRNETLGLREEKQMIVKEKTIEKQRWLIASVFLLLLFSLLFVFLLFRQNKLISRKSKKMVKINQELDARVKERTKTLQMTQYAVDMATDPIFVVQIEGVISYCNEATLFLLGYNRNEIRGLKFFDIVKDLTEELWNEYARHILQRGSYTLELVFVSQSDDLITMEVAFNARIYQDEQQIYAFCRNMEERKKQEHLLLEAKDRAERSDRLKSAFLANMSHEIRTPLNAIVGFSDLLARDKLHKFSREQIVDIIKSNSQDLITLINDIIDFSMIEANQLAVDKRLHFVLPMLEELIWVYTKRNEERDKKPIELRLHTPSNAKFYALYTDKSRLRQVLSNLLDNALKFTNKGFIELGFQLLSHGGRKMMRLYVKDTGSGIAQEDQQAVFQRFYKLDEVSKAALRGTGLGLAISKRLVGLLDGSMGLVSKKGEGSTFYIDVPYQYMNENVMPTIRLNSRSSSVLAGKTLLIVEDDKANFMLLEALLKPAKVKILHLANGSDVLPYMQRHRHQVDAVLLDIQLPGMNGDQVAHKLKGLYPDLPLVAQTAYGSKYQDEKNTQLFDSFLYKPIDKAELLHTLSAVLTKQ